VILKILTHNIRFGGSGRESLISEVIRTAEPDLVVFQEAILPTVIEGVAKEAGMPFWLSKPNHSIAYCSKIEIAKKQWHYPAGSRHPFLEIELAGMSVTVLGLHLRAMFSKWGERRRKQELHTLLSMIKALENGFHILTGDFNSIAPGELLDQTKLPGWIRALVWLSGRDIQRETVQLLLDRGYVDGFRLLHPGDKGYTFPTKDPHVRFDYFFTPRSYIDRLLDCRVFHQPPAAAASDHFPLLSVWEV
jgi:endonuclease/exonuclease/phosphatase family metal-dependent hydrolase